MPAGARRAGARGAARVRRRARAGRGPARAHRRRSGRRRARRERRGPARPGGRARLRPARRGDRARADRRLAGRDEGGRVRARPTARPATATVAVKEIKEKVLPPLDDDLARAASEFDTLAELRADIEQRAARACSRRRPRRSSARPRSTALVEASNVQVGGPLVEARTRELLNGLGRSLERRGISADDLLPALGPDRRAARRAHARRGRALGRARARARGGRRQARARGLRRRRSRSSIREQAEAAGRRRRRGDQAGLRRRPPGGAARRPAPAQGARPRRRRGEARSPSRSRARARRSGPRQGNATDRDETSGPPAARSQHEPVDPDGDRADLARRARVRHLLAPAERADHLPRHARSTTRSRT